MGIPFIPSVSEITPSEAKEIPGLAGTMAHWTEGLFTPGSWFEEVRESWGSAGLVMYRGDEVLGFAVYGPVEYLPRSERYPVAPISEGAVLLANIEGDWRVRKQLLVKVLRDLRQRNFDSVEAVTGIVAVPRHIPTKFLMQNGWQPVRRRGLYTLMRTDLENLVVTELARELLDRVKLPVMPKSPTPATFVQPAEASKDLVRSSGPQS